MNSNGLKFLLILLVPVFVYPKVLIFTYSYNRPDFIEIQHKTFKKFLKDDYEFIVFNDAPNHAMADQINQTCKRHEIKCIRIPQEIHMLPYLQRWPGENYNHPTVRNCNVVQYSLDTFGFFHDDIVALFDSDLFLIKEFSIRDYLKKHDLAGLEQSRTRTHINYLWIGLAFLNVVTMPNKTTLNFNCGRVEEIPVDAGGHTYYYLKNNPEAKVAYFDQMNFEDLRCDDCRRFQRLICTHHTQLLKNYSFSDPLIELVQSGVNMEIFIGTHFLHYRGGTNWDYQSPNFHENKTRLLNEFLNKIL